MNRLIHFRKSIALFLIVLPLACFGFLPAAQAVVPAPDGGYPGGNTAEGQSALASLTTGGFNTAVGLLSLRSNTTGSFNTAIGAGTLLANTGDNNTATGTGALLSNTTGIRNTANGLLALSSNTTGQLYTAIGDEAGLRQTIGSGNVYVGQGMLGVAGESNHTYIRNIKDTSVSGGNVDTVTVDLSTGLLGHLMSSRRCKEDIRPMDKASEAVFALKPVTYCYRKEIDPGQSPAFGLIAEDVAQVNPNLVARNAKGQPESVHYEMVNAMLLNEFLKEHQKVEQQQATISQLQSTVAKQKTNTAKQQKEIEVLARMVKEQATQIQKVSEQLELGKSSPQTVLNEQ